MMIGMLAGGAGAEFEVKVTLAGGNGETTIKVAVLTEDAGVKRDVAIEPTVESVLGKVELEMEAVKRLISWKE